VLKTYGEPIGAGAVLFAVVVLIIWVPYTVVQYRRRGRMSKRRALAEGAFVLYFACAWALVLYPFPTTQAAACARNPAPNLNPFAWVEEMNAALARSNYSGWRALVDNAPLFIRVFNLFLTVPFGIILRRWYRRGFLTTTLLGFVLSLSFELTQYTGIWGIYDCPYRVFDVDDLIANTAGASIGWVLAPIVYLLPKRNEKDDLPIEEEHASLFRRFVALSVDLFLWVLTYAVLIAIATVAIGIVSGPIQNPTPLATAMWLVSFLLVFVVVPTLANGATPGKALLRLRTAQANTPSRSARWWQLALRTAVLWLPPFLVISAAIRVVQASAGSTRTSRDAVVFLAVTVGFPLLWALALAITDWIRKDRRTIHDLATGTEVVVVPRKSVPPSLLDS